MALVHGVNCGFVTVAPTENPGEQNWTTDYYKRAIKSISPEVPIIIKEIGWHSSIASEESNFEVGIYTHDSGNNRPLDVIGDLNITNAKGTTIGWKRVTGLNISLNDISTPYWIALQVDEVAGIIAISYNPSGDSTCIARPTSSELPYPTWSGGGTPDVTSEVAIYALWEEQPNPNKGTIGTKEINKNWDEFGNKGKQINLVPQASNIPNKNKIGLL